MARSGWGRLALLAAVLFHWPTDVSALGLGEIAVHSALNEPLDAEIELTSADENELKTLKARLVTGADFDGAGLQPTRLSAIRVALIRDSDGRRALKLISEHPIREPFVRFVLQIDWAGGRLQREFTALVDPREPGAAATGEGASSEPRADASSAPGAAGASPPTRTSREIIDITDLRLDAKKEPRTRPTREAPPPAPTPTRERAPAAAKSQPQASPPERAGPAPPAESAAAAESDGPARAVQRQQIESEIRAWAQAQEQNRRRPKEDDGQRAEAAPPPEEPAVAAPPARDSVPAAKAPAPADSKRVAEASPSATTFDWLREHWRGLLMALVALVAVLVVVAGALMFLPYIRARHGAVEPSAVTGLPETDALQTEALSRDDERRSGVGRRRRFVPVAIERRQGLRRVGDQAPSAAQIVYPVEADTTEEANTYLALGAEGHAERVLKEAIAKQQWRHGLKLKLLALYYKRGDRDAFETLMNQLYVALEDEASPHLRDGTVPTGVSQAPGHPVFGNQDNDDEDTVLLPIPSARRAPMEPEPPQATPPKAPAPEGAPTEGKRREEPLLEAMEALELELPHVKTETLEQEMEVLQMNVPKGPEDLTERIRERSDAAEQAPATREPKEERDDQRGQRGAVTISDIDDIRHAVKRSMELLEPGEEKATSGISSEGANAEAIPAKKDKRRVRRSDKSNVDAGRRRWQDPALRIDLAKAYIDMGDVERARRILEEVLEGWQPGGGTRG